MSKRPTKKITKSGFKRKTVTFLHKKTKNKSRSHAGKRKITKLRKV